MNLKNLASIILSASSIFISGVIFLNESAPSSHSGVANAMIAAGSNAGFSHTSSSGAAIMVKQPSKKKFKG